MSLFLCCFDIKDKQLVIFVLFSLFGLRCIGLFLQFRLYKYAEGKNIISLLFTTTISYELLIPHFCSMQSHTPTTLLIPYF